MKKIILTLLIIQCSLLIATAQWYSVDNGTSGNITEIEFKNENTGWYVSDQCQIYKTTNVGMNWKCLDIQNIDSLYPMGRLICYGDTLLLSIGQTRILRSNNGGDNWFVINTNFNRIITLKQLVKKDLLFAFAYTSDFDYADLIKSTDLGLTWTDIYSFGGSELHFGICNFVNDSIGFCTGYRTISKTTNGGYNWYVIYNAPTQMDFMYFVNPNNGFLYMNGFRKTTDGGINWDSIGYYYPRCMTFENNNIGYLTTPDTSESLFKTMNGGNNWYRIFEKPPSLCLREFVDVEKINNTIYIAARYGGGLYKSTNGGVNFQDISKYVVYNYLNTIDFINAATGFTGGWQSGLLQTTNGGTNWFENQSFKNNSNYYSLNITKIQFLNQSTGLIGTDTGFFKTTNGGINWLLYSTQFHVVDNFKFINSLTGWIAGYIRRPDTTQDSIRIYKTTDGGMTFQFQLATEAPVNDVQFYDSLYGYIVTIYPQNTSRSLFRTTNGGNNWEAIGFRMFKSVEIIDRNVAYLTGGFGPGVYKTMTGGNNWFKIDSSYEWTKIKFINKNTGFLIGTKNIYYTTNSGTNWLYSILNSNGLGDIYFNNEGLGITVGGGGKIYKTTNYGGIIGINNHNEIIPGEYKLYQNYPNPFNTTTKIKFEIPPQMSFPRALSGNPNVKLLVFDILGREVQTLINKQLKPGSYEVTFNGDYLSSGIYFYSLFIEGKFIQTKKMIMIK